MAPASAAPEQIRMRKLDIGEAIKPGRIIVAIGKRGSGKSVLIRDILYQLRNTPNAVAMSPTEPGNGFYGQLLPKIFVYSEFISEKVDAILAHQIAQSKKGVAAPIVLILDDCMFDASRIFKQTSIKSIFLNGRHYQITLILGIQYSLNLPPWARAQIDVVFAMREPIHSNRERLYSMFFGCFPSIHAFSATLDACTENFECLCALNYVQSNALSDCCFYYRAPLHTDVAGKPTFRVGAPSMWRFAEMQRAKAIEARKNKLAPSTSTTTVENRRGSIVITKTTSSADASRRRRVLQL